MSEFNIMSVVYKDTKCLVESLKEIGYNIVEVHESPVSLVGYMGDQRDIKANIIIRRQYVGGMSNDIGFLKKPDGSMDLIISEFDLSCKQGKKFTEDLKQIYGKNMVLKTAGQLGLTTVLVKNENDGKIKITLLDR